VLAYIEAKRTQGKKISWHDAQQSGCWCHKVIEWRCDLCLNVFCVGWHLAVTANHSRKLTRTHWRPYFR